MATRKAFIKKGEDILLPYTRGELVSDSQGEEAFHSQEFVASETKTDSAVVECYVESSRVTGGQIVTKANTYGYSRVMYKLVVTTA